MSGGEPSSIKRLPPCAAGHLSIRMPEGMRRFFHLPDSLSRITRIKRGHTAVYQVLYRKWRPQAFSDVAGQPHVTTALKNELRQDRIAHAYLFTGSRGTGKTTCAKILAKAVNCLHPVDGDPCNDCDVCRGIDSGSILDVVEIDAASNNGVDNIRDLREEVNFTPSVAKYRVYIIDEVHMLSSSAFNALLKTLEEPPAHVIFILATTEVQELPATILSRCQRFDFSRIQPADIATRLHYVAEQEHLRLEADAALLLARLADGALRDALSLLDQCASRSDTITIDVVAESTGMAGRDYLFDLSAAVRTGDSGRALALIDRLYNASKDMERLCAEWAEYFRNLMILKSVPNGADLIVAPPSELEQMQQEADAFELVAVLHCIQVLQEALDRLRGGVSRRIEMEMAVLRLCSPELDTSVDSLLRRIKHLEDVIRSGVLPAASTTPVSASIPAPGVPSASVPDTAAAAGFSAADPSEAIPAPAPSDPSAWAGPSGSPEPPETAGSPTPAEAAAVLAAEAERPFDRWADVLEILAQSCPPLYGVLQDSAAAVRGDYVLIQTGNALFKSLVGRDGNKAILLTAIRSVTGQTYRLGIKKSAPAAVAAPEDPLSSFIQASRDRGVDLHIQE